MVMFSLRPVALSGRRSCRSGAVSVAEEISLDFAPIPEGFTVLEGVMAFKCIDESGHVRLVERMTNGLSRWEALGMTITMADTLRRELLDSTASPDDD